MLRRRNTTYVPNFEIFVVGLNAMSNATRDLLADLDRLRLVVITLGGEAVDVYHRKLRAGLWTK